MRVRPKWGDEFHFRGAVDVVILTHAGSGHPLLFWHSRPSRFAASTRRLALYASASACFVMIFHGSLGGFDHASTMGSHRIADATRGVRVGDHVDFAH
ncbi:hypothetical protein FAIPA1_320033 [Frankia sp. AiPs1]